MNGSFPILPLEGLVATGQGPVAPTADDGDGAFAETLSSALAASTAIPQQPVQQPAQQQANTLARSFGGVPTGDPQNAGTPSNGQGLPIGSHKLDIGRPLAKPETNGNQPQHGGGFPKADAGLGFGLESPLPAIDQDIVPVQPGLSIAASVVERASPDALPANSLPADGIDRAGPTFLHEPQKGLASSLPRGNAFGQQAALLHDGATPDQPLTDQRIVPSAQTQAGGIKNDHLLPAAMPQQTVAAAVGTSPAGFLAHALAGTQHAPGASRPSSPTSANAVQKTFADQGTAIRQGTTAGSTTLSELPTTAEAYRRQPGEIAARPQHPGLPAGRPGSNPTIPTPSANADRAGATLSVLNAGTPTAEQSSLAIDRSPARQSASPALTNDGNGGKPAPVIQAAGTVTPVVPDTVHASKVEAGGFEHVQPALSIDGSLLDDDRLATTTSMNVSKVQPSVAHAPAGNQIALQIVRALPNGVDRFSVHLQPAELGSVDIQLNFEPSGRLSALITVERPETLELLQRDSRTLERTLGDSGLKLTQDGLNFSLKQDHQHQQQHGQNFHEQAREQQSGLRAERAYDNSAEPEQIPMTSLRVDRLRLLDIET